MSDTLVPKGQNHKQSYSIFTGAPELFIHVGRFLGKKKLLLALKRNLYYSYKKKLYYYEICENLQRTCKHNEVYNEVYKIAPKKKMKFITAM